MTMLHHEELLSADAHPAWRSDGGLVTNDWRCRVFELRVLRDIGLAVECKMCRGGGVIRTRRMGTIAQAARHTGDPFNYNWCNYCDGMGLKEVEQ